MRAAIRLSRPLLALVATAAALLGAGAAAAAAPAAPGVLPDDLTTLTVDQLSAAVAAAQAQLTGLTAQAKQAGVKEQQAAAAASAARAEADRLRPQAAAFAVASYTSGARSPLDAFFTGRASAVGLLDRLTRLDGVAAHENGLLAALRSAEATAREQQARAAAAARRLAASAADADTLLTRLSAAQTYLARRGTGAGGVHSCVLDAGQLATAARLAGFRDGAGYAGRGLTYAVAVALAESSGDVGALNANTNHTLDRGPWQINSIHTQYTPAGLLHDPVYSARAAFALSGGGASFAAWSTFSVFDTVGARLTAAAAGVAAPEPLPACAPVTAAGGTKVLVVGDGLTAAGAADLTGQLGGYGRAVAVDAAPGRTLTAGVAAIGADLAVLPADGTLLVALGGDDPVMTGPGGPGALSDAAARVVVLAGGRRVLWVLPPGLPAADATALTAVAGAHPSLHLVSPGAARGAATSTPQGSLYRAAVLADAVGVPATYR